jgi:hypothetical protein
MQKKKNPGLSPDDMVSVAVITVDDNVRLKFLGFGVIFL